MSALDQAIKILGWFENLGPDEVPPSWMWPFEWELTTHFERVSEERDKKYGSKDDSTPDDYADWEENTHAARFK